MRTRSSIQKRQVPDQPNTSQYGKVQKTSNDMGLHDAPVDVDDDIMILYDEGESRNEYGNDDFISLDANTNFVENETELVDQKHTIKLIQIDDNEEQVEEQINEHNNEQNVEQDLNEENVTLGTVWKGISSLQTSISNISNSLESVSTRINTLDPRINNLETSLDNVKEQTNKFEDVQNNVSSLREELKKVTDELNALKSNPPTNNVNVSTIVTELRERERKSKNIIIHNVPEDNLSISEDYSTLEDIHKFNDLIASRDLSRARKILEVIPNIDIDDIMIKRIGRFNSNRCRPLVVTLTCNEDKLMVFRNRRLINRQYTVRTDMTKLQRNQIKELKEELERINANSHNLMTIKYINGEPKIVPMRNNFPKNE